MTNIIKKDNAQPATFGSVVDRLFQNNLNRFFDDDFFGFNGIASRNSVPVNIRETEKTFELEVVAPGLRKEDFQLNLAGDLLTISFQQQEEKKAEGKNESWLRQEYKKAAFSRSFNIDDTVDAAKATARYQDGILHLSLPKKESAQKVSRTITVQ
ncbi:MAG TPA: Hsp20/alpha crystallin family protein [Puia sp.]|jgi:HSP20 family protein|nr:Hsp20/alpha crystallin family protein [Puia sp.]